jgi:mRNA interferase RelE/StbE
MSYKVEVKDDFIKDCFGLSAKTRERVNNFIFNILPQTENPLLLFEKMKGFKTFYKKRFGDFRLGVEVNQVERKITILTIMNRKDIYKHFPPK